MEPLQLGARLDPELTDEHLAGPQEGLERLGLAAGSVQGDHQLAPPPLAERLLSDHGLELGDQLTRITGSEPRIDQILGRCASKLVEPLAFRRPEARVPVALEGGAAPETERLLEQAIGLRGLSCREETVCVAGELLETKGVDQVSGGLQRVGSPPRHDDFMARPR